MKTPDEIKRGLELCNPQWKDGHWKTCDRQCPYTSEMGYCRNVLHSDTLAYIRELEAKVAEQEKVKKERDRYWAFIRDMGCESCSGDCDKCDGQSGWTWSGAKMDEEADDALD